MQNDNLDEFDIIGQNFAYKLRGLSKEVKVMSEKFMNDILFEAEIGNINKYTKMSLQQLAQNQSFPALQSHTPFQLHTSLEPQLPHYYLQKPVLSHTQPASHDGPQLHLSVFPQTQQQSHNTHQPHISQDLQITKQPQSTNHLPTLQNLTSSGIMQTQQYSQAEITKDSAMVGIRDYYEQSSNSEFSN